MFEDEGSKEGKNLKLKKYKIVHDKHDEKRPNY